MLRELTVQKLKDKKLEKKIRKHEKAGLKNTSYEGGRGGGVMK